jgi:hypothetical protein
MAQRARTTGVTIVGPNRKAGSRIELSLLRVERSAKITRRADYRPWAVAMLHAKQLRRTVATAGSSRSTIGAARRVRARPRSLADYKIPAMRDLPAISRIAGWRTSSPTARFGAKGVWRGRMLAVLPAIANALDHAVGIRLTGLPLSPQTVCRAICAKAGYPLEEEKDVTSANVYQVALARGRS